MDPIFLFCLGAAGFVYLAVKIGNWIDEDRQRAFRAHLDSMSPKSPPLTAEEKRLLSDDEPGTPILATAACSPRRPTTPAP